MFKPNSIILYVDDVDVSTGFYSAILGKAPAERFEDFTVFSLNEEMVLGLQSKHSIDPATQAAFGGFELCLSNASPEEVDKLYQEWKKQNVSIAMAPTMLAFGYTFVALDPDGHRLRVCATDTSNIVQL